MTLDTVQLMEIEIQIQKALINREPVELTDAQLRAILYTVQSTSQTTPTYTRSMSVGQ